MGRGKTKRQRATAAVNARALARARSEVRAELTQELYAKALEAVCRERQTVFGPSQDHEYVPVLDGDNLNERCVDCGQVRPSQLPVDAKLRLAYIEMIVPPDRFQLEFAGRQASLQSEKWAEQQRMYQDESRQLWGQLQSAPFHPSAADDLMQALTRQMDRAAADALILGAQSSEVRGPSGAIGSISGMNAGFSVVDEATEKFAAAAFNLDNRKPMTIKFDMDSDEGWAARRKIRELLDGSPVISSESASKIIGSVG